MIKLCGKMFIHTRSIGTNLLDFKSGTCVNRMLPKLNVADL